MIEGISLCRGALGCEMRTVICLLFTEKMGFGSLGLGITNNKWELHWDLDWEIGFTTKITEM